MSYIPHLMLMLMMGYILMAMSGLMLLSKLYLCKQDRLEVTHAPPLPCSDDPLKSVP